MATLYFVTHPEVVVDPRTPVPRWGLSEVGFLRARRFASHPFLGGVRRVVSSDERKATETGAIISEACGGVELETRPELGEHDRSSTGFVGGPRFDLLVAAFFAKPDESSAGWAPARREQTRIVDAIDQLVADTAGDDMVVVSHGGVGTLLLCALNNWPIDRRRDQPSQGHWYAVDTTLRRARSGWTPLEEVHPRPLLP
jgi:broad specificity phosphatase PhoE